MKIIVAIGGGEIKDLDTLSIDEEIVRLTGKDNPRALFIPTASNDAEGYWQTFQEVYGEILGCKTEVLYLIKEKPVQREIEKKILGADLIYVGGGNTQKMLEIWREKGVDKLLKKAYEKGIVLSGLSAGAICWFKYGSSDSPSFSNPKDSSIIRIDGLDLVDLTVSPHHIREKHRDEGLAKLMKETPGVGIALDDNSALEIIDDKYRVIFSKNGVGAKKVYYLGEKLVSSQVQIGDFRPLKELIEK